MNKFTKKTDTTKFINKQNLKMDRGWTDGLINKFLPKPDLELPNPYYKNAANMKYYKLSRISKIEKTEIFNLNFEKTNNFKTSAKKAVETKTNKLVEVVEKIEISVPKMSEKDLINNAINHYNMLHLSRGDFKYVDTNYTTFSDDFIKRISENYLRHRLTDYEKHLRALYKKTGKTVAIEIIRDKICDEIYKQYPCLK